MTKTVAGSIANTSTFEAVPAVFLYGMFCAEVGAMIWILVATYLELPVSTTHSISKYIDCGLQPFRVIPIWTQSNLSSIITGRSMYWFNVLVQSIHTLQHAQVK